MSYSDAHTLHCLYVYLVYVFTSLNMLAIFVRINNKSCIKCKKILSSDIYEPFIRHRSFIIYMSYVHIKKQRSISHVKAIGWLKQHCIIVFLTKAVIATVRSPFFAWILSLSICVVCISIVRITNRDRIDLGVHFRFISIYLSAFKARCVQSTSHICMREGPDEWIGRQLRPSMCQPSSCSWWWSWCWWWWCWQ